MTHFTTTEHIEAPPDVVWTFISDLRRIPEWVIGTKEMLSISTDPVVAGTEYRERTQIGPMASETSWCITVFHSPSVQTHESRSAMLNAVLTMAVEPEDGETRLTHSVAYQLLPKMRPLGRLLELVMHRKSMNDMRQSLQTAKHIIEREFSRSVSRRTAA